MIIVTGLFVTLTIGWKGMNSGRVSLRNQRRILACRKITSFDRICSAESKQQGNPCLNQKNEKEDRRKVKGESSMLDSRID